MAAVALGICCSQRKSKQTSRMDPSAYCIVRMDLFDSNANIEYGFRKHRPVKCNVYDSGRWIFNGLPVGRTHCQSKPIRHLTARHPDLFRLSRSKPPKCRIQRRYDRSHLLNVNFDFGNCIRIHYCSTNLTETLQNSSIPHISRSRPV